MATMEVDYYIRAVEGKKPAALLADLEGAVEKLAKHYAVETSGKIVARQGLNCILIEPVDGSRIKAVSRTNNEPVASMISSSEEGVVLQVEDAVYKLSYTSPENP